MRPFDQRWEELETQGEQQVFQRVDDRHPLDFYLGRDISGNWILLLVTDQQPPPSHHFQAIHINSRLRHDGRWALMFQLTRPELGKVFSHLCEDLVESSRTLSDPGKSVSFVMARFSRWQRLLERGRSGLLELNELRGLMGELLVLEQVIVPRHGIEPSLRGWTGPLGADQDFVFEERRYEVKTIRRGTDTISISSAEQLDITDQVLMLEVVILDDVPLEGGGLSFSPLELVGRLRTMFEPLPSVLVIFEERLLSAGFIECEEYAKYRFACRGIRQFRVDRDFPKIVRSGLPQGIGRVSYEVRLENCLLFEDQEALTVE